MERAQNDASAAHHHRFVRFPTVGEGVVLISLTHLFCVEAYLVREERKCYLKLKYKFPENEPIHTEIYEIDFARRDEILEQIMRELVRE